MIKIVLKIILIISIMGCNHQNVHDLARISFGENVSPILKTLSVDNSYSTDSEKKIWNYFINEEKSQVSYENIVLNEDVELGVVNNRIQGYKGVASDNETSKSNVLLKKLMDRYGKGKLIRTDGKKNHVYIWKKDDVIIHYLIGVSTITEGTETISGSLTIVSEKALEQGLWPYSKGLLAASNLPDLR